MKTRQTTGLIYLAATLCTLPALAQSPTHCEPTIVRASSEPMPSPYWQAVSVPPSGTQGVRPVGHNQLAEIPPRGWHSPAPRQLPITLVNEPSAAASQPPSLMPSESVRPYDSAATTIIQRPAVVYHPPTGSTTLMPMTTYRPVLPPPPPALAPKQYLGKGLWGQTKVYGSNQPIRNFLRFLSF